MIANLITFFTNEFFKFLIFHYSIAGKMERLLRLGTGMLNANVQHLIYRLCIKYLYNLVCNY